MSEKDIEEAKKWADEELSSEGDLFERALRRISPVKPSGDPHKEPNSECDRCCHHYVCGMCTIHKAEHYSGCDFFMPYFKPVFPFVTYETETEFRNVCSQYTTQALIIKKSQEELDTLDHTDSGLLE